MYNDCCGYMCEKNKTRQVILTDTSSDCFRPTRVMVPGSDGKCAGIICYRQYKIGHDTVNGCFDDVNKNRCKVNRCHYNDCNNGCGNVCSCNGGHNKCNCNKIAPCKSNLIKEPPNKWTIDNRPNRASGYDLTLPGNFTDYRAIIS
jgi:hypothetical protein